MCATAELPSVSWEAAPVKLDSCRRACSILAVRNPAAAPCDVAGGICVQQMRCSAGRQATGRVNPELASSGPQCMLWHGEARSGTRRQRLRWHGTVQGELWIHGTWRRHQCTFLQFWSLDGTCPSLPDVHACRLPESECHTPGTAYRISARCAASWSVSCSRAAVAPHLYVANTPSNATWQSSSATATPRDWKSQGGRNFRFTLHT